LSAVLVYGYPVLGLALLLGAIGLPGPVGLATVLAGSLAGQGRLDACAAVTIAAGASILGDLVGYDGLGRWVGADVLARWGRWVGTRPRVTKGWRDSLHVGAVTRTPTARIGSVANLLAGVSRYRLSTFAAAVISALAVFLSRHPQTGAHSP
jgi:membrane protein DedA with SNARE-associated domain